MQKKKVTISVPCDMREVKGMNIEETPFLRGMLEGNDMTIGLPSVLQREKMLDPSGPSVASGSWRNSMEEVNTRLLHSMKNTGSTGHLKGHSSCDHFTLSSDGSQGQNRRHSSAEVPLWSNNLVLRAWSD